MPFKVGGSRSLRCILPSEALLKGDGKEGTSSFLVRYSGEEGAKRQVCVEGGGGKRGGDGAKSYSEQGAKKRKH